VKVLCLLLLTAAAADGQSFHPGRCPRPSVQEDFNVTKYMGTWYEIEKLPAVFERGKCNQATYISNRPQSNGKINSIEGVAKVKNSSQPAILDVSFFKGVPDAPYWVLSTDYHSYSLVYSCSNYFGLFHIDFAWILARTRVLSEQVISELHDEGNKPKLNTLNCGGNSKYFLLTSYVQLILHSSQWNYTR
uniref:Apolipoprotein D n=1 Tax=Sparus aurata TaxID=8175 RepID=A0A671XWS9_SPAAU